MNTEKTVEQLKNLRLTAMANRYQAACWVFRSDHATHFGQMVPL